MKTRWLWALPIVLALPLPAQEAKAPAPPEGAGKATGVELGTPATGAAARAKTRCTLTLTPSTASNGQTFGFSVAYTPCLTAPETETFTFKWPSTLATFHETTVRQKIFKVSGGCIASSFDNTLVPSALAIKGTFKATVAVKNTTTNAPICTASAQMTVN